jgi:1-acyl-sn-glycerol-3-phosphate acyltransferase
MRVTAKITASVLAGGARLLTGVRPNWVGCLPEPRQRIYLANHTSHGDFVLIWTVLPQALRTRTRPVAAAEYWSRGKLRRFVGQDVFNAVLIAREGVNRSNDPRAPLLAALDAGNSLILFPEGTRNTTDAKLLPFKSGLFHVARARPDVELVPVWIDDLSRVMPKGELLPIPLLCNVTFGAPLQIAPQEPKTVFLERARQALMSLAPRSSES